jgi:hypothetical protein
MRITKELLRLLGLLNVVGVSNDTTAAFAEMMKKEAKLPQSHHFFK